MHPRSIFVVLIFVLLKVVTGSNQSNIPPGSARLCLDTKGNRIAPFEVLAGGGWDNLRNRDMAMVMKINYTHCRTTDDGRFLIPDNLYTIPLKSSMVDTYAEMFEHWNNYTSTVSSTINAHAGLNLPHIGISGKFGKGYTDVKSHQYFDKAVTTRVQVRYARYTAKLSPSSPISDVFRNRLRKIAAHLRLNRTDSARYESQLVVRDFGTHVVTCVDAGATLSQRDHVETSFVQKYESQKNSILASASASFFGVFNFGIDYSMTTTTEMTDAYKKARTKSEVETYGGPIFRPKNYTGNEWSTAIDQDLVAIDRSGDPIYYVINDDTLPDLPVDTMIRVRSFIKEAVELYYKQNMYHGCTSPESPNFSFQANVDDGTCEPAKTNYTFGGVYQTCSGSGYTDLCATMRQKNPMTGDYTCSKGYEAVLINGGSKSSSRSRHTCHSCYLFFHCCNDVTDTASAQYTAYWCAATGPVPEDSGFLFGGLYTQSVSNIMTGGSDCPSKFYALHILDNLMVCVSDDYELGTSNSIPFAGFFACKSGNPLALDKNAGLLKSGQMSVLEKFMLDNGASHYPRRCPQGFSQHLAVNDRGCEIHYCVKAGALTPRGLPKVHLPPFMEMPKDRAASNEEIVFSDDGAMWTTMDDAKQNMDTYLQEKGLPSPAESIDAGTGQEQGGGTAGTEGGSGDEGGVSPGSAATISIFVTLAVVGVVGLAYYKIRGRKRRGLLYE